MSRYFQLLISEEFVERTIPEDDSVRLLDQIVDELDLHPEFATCNENET